jgi:hypothetical protein
MKYALIETTPTPRFTGKIHEFGTDIPPDLSHKASPLKWVPYSIMDSPIYDPSIEKLKRINIITIDSFEQIWQKIPLSPTEQTNYIKAQQEATELNTIELLYDDLVAGTGDPSQRLRRIERFLVYLFKNFRL